MAQALTPKQERFCQLYMETGSASEAYRTAYDANNMKPATVNRKAKDLIDNGKIAARVSELRAVAVERHSLTMDAVLEELAAVGFANVSDFMREGPNGSEMIPLDQLPRELAAAISEVVVTETVGRTDGIPTQTRNIKIKLHPKIPALVKLGEHLGGFVKNVRMDGEVKHTVVDGTAEDVANEIMEIFGKHGSSSNGAH